MGGGSASGNGDHRSQAVSPPSGDARPVAPTLRPPGSIPDPDAHAAGSSRWLWAALAATAALGVAVVVALPQLVSERAPSAPPPLAAPSSSPPASPQADKTGAARGAAEQALRDFLRLRARLELADADRWAAADWRLAAEQASGGDRLFAQQRFGAAAEEYASALDTLEAVEAGRDQRLAEALDGGRQALDADDGAAAATQFELALVIEPEQPQALQGLGRARVREEVLRRLEGAGQAEQAGRLEAARTGYREALQLDGQYQPAAAGLQRVEQRLAEDTFRQAMSETLAALAAGRLGEAGQALQRAAAVRPDDPGVSDARQRLATAGRSAQLERLRSGAATRVRGEDWGAALEFYEKALALEPGAGFARQGLARARERARLHQQLDHYLAEAGRLHSPEPLAAAEQLLAAAGVAPADEPRLAAKLASLQRRVGEARTPVRVTLESDGETEVVIYHVGRLGRFQLHQLELLPGTYTAVGSRAGYRDVRTRFSVGPGRPPPAVRLRCEERI